jgi:hypothetical protein
MHGFLEESELTFWIARVGAITRNSCIPGHLERVAREGLSLVLFAE